MPEYCRGKGHHGPEPIDALFIDINMPDVNGMDFIKSLDASPLVVFTTAYSSYAIEGYKVNAVDYLLNHSHWPISRRLPRRSNSNITYDIRNLSSHKSTMTTPYSSRPNTA